MSISFEIDLEALSEDTSFLERIFGGSLTRSALSRLGKNAVKNRIVTNAVPQTVRYVAVLDSRTTDICRQLDDTTWPVGSPDVKVPPLHWNCLTGDTKVSTSSPISNIYRRAYKGFIVNFATESGRSIDVTPNHPILTGRGWIAAKDVNSRDELICVEQAQIVENQEYSMETTFSDLFSSAEIAVDSRFIRDRPTTSEDFHGDVTDTDVSVINVNSLGWDRLKASLYKGVEYSGFSFGSRVKFSLKRLGSKAKGFIRDFSPSGGFVSVLGKGRNLFRSRPIHSCLLLLGSISKGFVFSLKNCLDRACRAIESQFFGYSINTNAGIVHLENGRDLIVSKSTGLLNASASKDVADCSTRNAVELPDLVVSQSLNGVESDKIVGIKVRKFTGHVYNLQNEHNWYSSNGIITHNCRSQLSYEGGILQ